MNTDAVVAGIDHIVRLQEVALPELTESRLRVRTWFSGVSCGTEADSVSGRATYITRPFLSGYQAVGEVVAVGSGVRLFQPGDVVFTTGGALWEMLCLFGGSHARELVLEEADAERVARTSPSLKSTAFATLAAVALEGISRMKLEPGRVMVVYGLGLLGMMAGKFAKLLGLRVIGVNRTPWKRDQALAFGFDAVCAPSAEEIAAAIASLGCESAHYAVDLTGNQQIFDLALDQLDYLGELSLLGYYPDAFSVKFDICHGKQITIHNPVGLGDQLPKVIRYIDDGQFNIEPLIRHTITPDSVTAFYGDLVSNNHEYLGVVIDWRE